MGAKINFQHIILLQHHLVASIWGVMSSTMIYAEPCWESHSTFDIVSLLQALMPRQRSNTVLDALRNFRQCMPGFDVLLRPLSDLSMDLCTMPVIVQEVVVHSIQMALLLVGSAEGVLIPVLANLTLGILTIWKEIRNRYSWR